MVLAGSWWPFVRSRAVGVVAAPSGERRIELPRRDGLLLRAGSVPVRASEQRFPLMVVRLDFSRVPRALVRGGTEWLGGKR